MRVSKNTGEASCIIYSLIKTIINVESYKNMNISIGILAYNEAKVINKTLNSLIQQDIFQDTDKFPSLEIIVVPNGCKDNTAEISSLFLEESLKSLAINHCSWQVCELMEPGKSNAWNIYVHNLSNPKADYLFLMDADIQFSAVDTLKQMIETFDAESNSWVVTSRPIKNVVLKEKKSFMDRLSSQTPGTLSHEICGQLYCSRASVLRKIWMPLGLPVEDGFLRAMIVTDRFTGPEDFSRVSLSPKASHIFEAYTDISALLQHEKRIVIGSTINSWIYNYLWANSNYDQDAGKLIQQNNQQNPSWLSEMIDEKINKSGWWLIPNILLWGRFKKLKQYPLSQSLIRLPYVILASIAYFLVFFIANQEIHKTGGLGYWGRKS